MRSQAHLPGGEVAHDFLGPAADGLDLDLAVKPFNRIAAQIPGAAQDLHGFGTDELHGLGRGELGL